MTWGKERPKRGFCWGSTKEKPERMHHGALNCNGSDGISTTEHLTQVGDSGNSRG